MTQWIAKRFAAAGRATPRPWLAVLAGCALLVLAARQLPGVASSASAQEYDLVILNGRVIDPESHLDAVRHLGIAGGKIQAISRKPLRGRTALDARGLSVAPGFIDLHAHGQDEENYRFYAMDGVTTALELEVGTADVDAWYAERKGKALVHYGVSVGHIPVRMRVMDDPGTFLPTGDAATRAATEAEIKAMKEHIASGLQRGAVAVGFGVAYTAAAVRWEILEMFRVAARYGASAHVHVRGGESGVRGVEEVIAAAAITGAPLHIVHVNSSGARATPRLLQMIGEAQARGLDVTTECYPYTAGMTLIESALFDQGWQEQYQGRLQWVESGEWLTPESFARYRKSGGMVIIHTNPEEVVQGAVASPLTLIASDGFLENGKGHPRTAGTYARVLGRYVRAAKVLTWMDALRKMTLLPARRLERWVPMMKNKGRIRVGADADLTIFDPERVRDQATYQEPAKFSQGIQYVLVRGVLVVKDGKLQEGVAPGRPLRAPIPSEPHRGPAAPA